MIGRDVCNLSIVHRQECLHYRFPANYANYQVYGWERCGDRRVVRKCENDVRHGRGTKSDAEWDVRCSGNLSEGLPPCVCFCWMREISRAERDAGRDEARRKRRKEIWFYNVLSG